MNHVRRLPIVAVIGSGDPDHGNPDLAAAIGRLIAEMGFHLLTGGGRGVMADACRGFTSVTPMRRFLSKGKPGIVDLPSTDDPQTGRASAVE